MVGGVRNSGLNHFEGLGQNPRDALRSGSVWLEGSRQYASLESYLIPKDRWEQLRQTYCEMVGIPADGKVQLEVKQAALEKSLAQLDNRLPKNEFVRIENGELVLTPLDEEEAEIRKEHPLAKKIGALLPPVQLGLKQTLLSPAATFL